MSIKTQQNGQSELPYKTEQQAVFLKMTSNLLLIHLIM